MKKVFIFLYSLCFTISLFGQVTFIVNELPKNHDYTKSVYISGDFEGWSGGQETYKLVQQGKRYLISLTLAENTIQYKFTMGSWNSVEHDINGEDLGNRNYKFHKQNDTVYVKIGQWDKGIKNDSKKSTSTKNVHVISDNFKIPQLKRERKIWVYLPPDYKDSKIKYPVLYMHDGQNIFDSASSYSGEWEVDETLDKLFEKNNFKVIVVAIANGGVKRLDEYSPWVNEKYGGGAGDAYVEFIVKTLKPYIDTNYRTLTNRKNTAIIGSSMGGLISYYAGLKYPKTFGKVGVFSPAFWFSPKVNVFSKQNGNIKNTKMYFLAGGKEGNNTAFTEINQTVKDMYTIIDILKAQGFPIHNIKSKVVPEGKHNEKLWKTNFEEAVLWLFNNQ